MIIEVGQLWKDKDKREPHRILCVVEIKANKVALAVPGHGTLCQTFIRKDRLLKRWQFVEGAQA